MNGICFSCKHQNYCCRLDNLYEFARKNGYTITVKVENCEDYDYAEWKEKEAKSESQEKI